RPRVRRIGARAARRDGRGDRAGDAERVLLQERVDPRQREAVERRVRVDEPALRQISGDADPPRSRRVLEARRVDMEYRVAELERGGMLEKPDAAGQQHRERVNRHVLDTAIAIGPAVASTGEEGAEVADARASEPGERVA